ncbi:MFS transporter [Kitasatospora saccharophila]|uniref:MFS transporter n=1 Tax=Kitasatospora saccharophila TaxID=407973 RepID=A0ABN2XBY7_9ACTN
MTTFREIETPRQQSLWSRDLTLFLTARTVSALGDAMLPVALTVVMLDLGYGASGVGYALAAWMAPFALLVLFGGVLADRYSPRRVMIHADNVRLVVQAVLAVELFGGDVPLWHLLVGQAVSGAAAALFQPGVMGIMAQVATDVQRAGAVLRTGESLARMAGPVLSALCVALSGAGASFAINGATFGVSALCLTALRVSAAPPARKAAESTWRSLVTGWREFRSRRWLWMVILVWAVNGLLVFGPQLPLLATVIVGEHGSRGYAVVEAALGTGMVAGGLVALRLRPARPLAAGLLAMLPWALPPLATAAGWPLAVVAAASAVAGTGWAFWSVMWASTVATHVPAGVVNRVYAYDVAGSVLSIPIGRALAGPVGELTGNANLLAASAWIGVAGCLVLLSARPVRDLRRIETPVAG